MNIFGLADLDVPYVDVAVRVPPDNIVRLAGDGAYSAQARLGWNLWHEILVHVAKTLTNIT